MNTSPRHNSDKRVIRTKKAIRNALFKMMETKELSHISISELTAGANVNRRTFYTHYSDITEILDEIEAALDEVNVDKFADYIKKYSEKTQFVIITHRRGTMEAAERLYGVAMHEKGISDVISIDVSEIEQKIGIQFN